MSKATVRKFRFNLKNRGRVIAGFALGGMMLASAGPVNDINASLAAPRGAMGMGLTNIRAYLLSGDDALAADLAENLRGEVDKFLEILSAA